MKPWDFKEIVIENGEGICAGGRWLYGDPDQEIALVSKEAPGGADVWAEMFQASPALARALLSTYGGTIECDYSFTGPPDSCLRLGAGNKRCGRCIGRAALRLAGAL